MIRFDESEVRPMGRGAKGVRGIDLEGDDEVAGSAVPHPDVDLVVVTRKGRAKRFPLTEVRRQGRAGKGVTVVPDVERTGTVAGMVALRGDAPLVFELAAGPIVAGRAGALRTSDRRGPAKLLDELADLGPVAAVHVRLGTIGAAGPGAGRGSEAIEEPAAAEAQGVDEDSVGAGANQDEDSVGAGANQGELDLPG
jgi:DNA gyrase subunit A